MISIIVPVYNTSKYLPFCIDSILRQTYKNFKLILINDGSTDNCKDIIEDYRHKDKRIIAVHNTNRGVSAARNQGIEISNTPLITFIDSDDWIEDDYIESLLYPCKDEIDIIISGIRNYRNNDITSIITLSNYEYNLFNGEDLFSLVKTELFTSPVGKIYKKSIIDSYNIKFNTALSYAEDKEFNLEYIKYAKKGNCISYSGYFYRNDTEYSLTKCSHKNILYNSSRQWQILKEIFQQRNMLNTKIVNEMLSNELFNIINDYISKVSQNQCEFENFINIDFNYLKKNKSLIHAPCWKKKIIIYNKPKILIIIYKIYFWIKKIQIALLSQIKIETKHIINR